MRTSLVLGLLLGGCGGAHDQPRAEDWIALSGPDTPLRHLAIDQQVDDKSCVRAEGLLVRGAISDATVAEIIAAVREDHSRDLIQDVRSNGTLAEVWTGKECGGPGGGHGEVLDLRREAGHWILRKASLWVH